MSEITPNTPNPVREDAYVEELSEKLGIDPQYIPKSPVWRNEEEIRAIAEMFANMSGGGSGGGVLVVNVDMQTRTLDKTWKEISDAPFAVLRFPHPEMGGTAIAYNTITYIISGSTYKVKFNDPAYGVTEFTTDSEDGYPSFSE